MQILFFAVCVGKSLKITECEYMYNFCIQTRYIIFINVIAYIRGGFNKFLDSEILSIHFVHLHLYPTDPFIRSAGSEFHSRRRLLRRATTLRIDLSLWSVSCTMKLEKEHWRAMIFYDFKSGLKQQDCLERLMNAFGAQAPSRATVYNWFAEFRRHRETLQDAERSGRPCSATTEENVTAVQKLVEDDARITTAFIAAQLQISVGTVSTILHDSLGLSKVSCRWIPHILTTDQKRQRVSWCQSMLRRFDGGESRAVCDIVSGDETWVYTFDPESKQQSFQWTPVGSPPPLKAARSRSVTKQMVAVFVSRSGLICCVPLVEQRNVTASWYTTVCLPQLIAAASENPSRTRRRDLLLTP